VAMRRASRGEIWFVQLPTDPREKGRRPVLVVSSEARNRHERADTVLVVPLSTSVHKAGSPTHLRLLAGETGLAEDSIASWRYHSDAEGASAGAAVPIANSERASNLRASRNGENRHGLCI